MGIFMQFQIIQYLNIILIDTGIFFIDPEGKATFYNFTNNASFFFDMNKYNFDEVEILKLSEEKIMISTSTQSSYSGGVQYENIVFNTNIGTISSISEPSYYLDAVSPQKLITLNFPITTPESNNWSIQKFPKEQKETDESESKSDNAVSNFLYETQYSNEDLEIRSELMNLLFDSAKKILLKHKSLEPI